MAADARSADDEIIESSLERFWSAAVPVVLEENCVDSIFSESSDPVQAILACIEPAIDPELEQTIALATLIESNV